MAQKTLPDVVPGVDPGIEKTARIYVDARDRRMAMTKDEIDAQSILLDAMKHAGVDQYRTTDGLLCTLDNKEKVKVSKAKHGEE